MIFLCAVAVPSNRFSTNWTAWSVFVLFFFVFFSNHFHTVTVLFTTLSSTSPGVSQVKSLVLPPLVCRQSWKKWWSGSTPRLTVRTRAARARELRPRRALHRSRRSPKRKSNLTKSSLFFPRKASVVMSQFGVGPQREIMTPVILFGSDCRRLIQSHRTSLCFTLPSCLYQLLALSRH